MGYSKGNIPAVVGIELPRPTRITGAVERGQYLLELVFV